MLAPLQDFGAIAGGNGAYQYTHCAHCMYSIATLVRPRAKLLKAANAPAAGCRPSEFASAENERDRRRGDGMMTSVIRPVGATALGNGACGLRVDGGRIVTEDCRCVAPASA
jgi:hypothetical protein